MKLARLASLVLLCLSFLWALPCGASPETFEGWVQVEEDSVSPRVLIVNNQQDFREFQALLPARRPQKKQPAPPNNDPLRNRSFDFEKQLLVIVIRAQTLSFHPKLVDQRTSAGTTTLTFRLPPLQAESRPYGLGVYSAVVLAKTDRELKIEWDTP